MPARPGPLKIWSVDLTVFALVWLGIAAPAAADTHQFIEAFADAQSIGPGETLNFYVHVPIGSQIYNVEVWRYGKSDASTASTPQLIAGPFPCANGSSQPFDASSFSNGLLGGANPWQKKFELKISTAALGGFARCTGGTTYGLSAGAWKSGIYTLRLVDNRDLEDPKTFQVTFVVKDTVTDQRKILVVASSNTWQAYNFWPSNGAFYNGNCGLRQSSVSFFRPNPYADPDSFDRINNNCTDQSYFYTYFSHFRTLHLAAGEVRVLRWLERPIASKPRYEYSMISDWDLETVSGVLDPLKHRAVIISTHSEYWSQNMYDRLKAYLSAGGNVMVLSGNSVFGKVTLNAAGTNRTMTKVLDPEQNLVLWPKTEQLGLTGLWSFAFSGTTGCAPYRVTPKRHWVLQGTPGDASYGGAVEFNTAATGDMVDIVRPWSEISGSTAACGTQSGGSGWEVDNDGDAADMSTVARNYVQLGAGTNQNVHPDSLANIVLLRRTGGGQVFNTGSITFGQSLVKNEANLDRIMMNVLDRFAKPDIVARSVGNLSGYKSTNNSAGTIIQGNSFISSGWDIFSDIISPGDFSGDGKRDLIGRTSSDGKLWLIKADGNGGFDLPGRTEIGNGWDSTFLDIIGPGDFDGDRKPDLLTRRSSGTLLLYRGNGAGGFLGPGQQIDSGWQLFDKIVAPGDFDGDGKSDVLARRASNMPSPGTLWLYRGTGTGGLVQNGGTNIAQTWGSYTQIITPGDFNGDDMTDVIVRESGGALRLFQGNGTGGFASNAVIDNGWNIYNLIIGVNAGDMTNVER